MGIQIFDNGASLLFFRNGQEQMIMKRSIREISIVRESIIKIDRGSFQLDIYLPYGDIRSPNGGDVMGLVDIIVQMITGCICNGNSTGGSGG